MDILFVRVETDDGFVGWGEAFGYAVWPATRVAIERLIAPLATGADEADIAGVTMDIQKKLHLVGRTGPVVYGLSGPDIESSLAQFFQIMEKLSQARFDVTAAECRRPGSP